MWKCTKLKVYTAFLFMGQAFWKENIEDRVKLLESNILNGCLKITRRLKSFPWDALAMEA